MQTPAGQVMGADGVLHVDDWWQVIFNPSFPYRFTHMVAAAYLTTAFIVGGIGAWYILRDQSVPHGRVMLGMALSLLVWLAPLQVVIGDLSGLNARRISAGQDRRDRGPLGHRARRAADPVRLARHQDREQQIRDRGAEARQPRFSPMSGTARSAA